jgi:hypothetical protein
VGKAADGRVGSADLADGGQLFSTDTVSSCNFNFIQTRIFCEPTIPYIIFFEIVKFG